MTTEYQDALSQLMQDYTAAMYGVRKFALGENGYEASHALEWSAGTFAAAARADVLQRCICAMNTMIGNEKTEEFVARHLASFARMQMTNGAEHPHRSTSPTANLMHECTTAAWARVHGILESHLQ